MFRTIMDCVVMETECLAPDVFSLRLQAPEIATEAKAGQFVSLYSHDGGHLMPRPISLCEIDRENGSIRLVYRVVGFGTAEFSMMKPGNKVRVMGPLGNGFPIEENINKNRKNAILIGGGIGIPPMISVAQDIQGYLAGDGTGSVTAVCGYRDRHTFLSDDFIEVTDNFITATDDGSVGVCGTVIDALNAQGITGDVIYACGPGPMLRGVKEWAAAHGIIAWISLEERMACGIGACLGCVTETTGVDEHSQVRNARICKDGPVFEASAVIL